ncbi:MAG: phage virion morphogenesis protein [Melioribacteraceae bacterium]|nr:phage virion morphogenesis protein [Melioribacteraceae bacterium]MCF8414544.1 phage virion morphogenesis protein [Melioribacteraceae bacterium]
MAKSYNLEEVNKLFREYKDKFTPNKPMMTAIAGHMLGSAQENIRNGGKGASPAWPKRKMFPGREKGLVRSGSLLRSVQAKATDNTAIAFTNKRYAKLQHFGGVIKAKKILGSVNRKRDVYAMEQYFWAQYFKSNKKEKLWMVLALHVAKAGQIKIPARPFMYLNKRSKAGIKETVRSKVTQ